MAKSKLLSIFVILSLLVLPLVFAIDTSSDGNNIGSISSYLSTFSKFIGAALVPMTIFSGDSTDYDCNTEHKSGAVVADNSGIISLSNQNPQTEWIRISIVDSSGFIKDNGFWKKGTDYSATFIAGRTYTYHIFKCVPKGTSTGGIPPPICTQEAGSLCNPISGRTAGYSNGCMKTDLQKQGYTSSDLTLCPSTPCNQMGGYITANPSCPTGYQDVASLVGVRCCVPSAADEIRCLNFGGVVTTICKSTEEKILSINGISLSLPPTKICCTPKVPCPSVAPPTCSNGKLVAQPNDVNGCPAPPKCEGQVCASVCTPLYELNKNCALNNLRREGLWYF